MPRPKSVGSDSRRLYAEGSMDRSKVTSSGVMSAASVSEGGSTETTRGCGPSLALAGFAVVNDHLWGFASTRSTVRKPSYSPLLRIDSVLTVTSCFCPGVSATGSVNSRVSGEYRNSPRRRKPARPRMPHSRWAMVGSIGRSKRIRISVVDGTSVAPSGGNTSTTCGRSGLFAAAGASAPAMTFFEAASETYPVSAAISRRTKALPPSTSALTRT